MYPAPSRLWEHTDGQDKFICPLVAHSLEKETNENKFSMGTVLSLRESFGNK